MIHVYENKISHTDNVMKVSYNFGIGEIIPIAPIKRLWSKGDNLD